MNNCPICLDNCQMTVNICKNKHISCIQCIKQWRQSSDTCPICRSLMVISGKYDPEKHKLQHRFDDSYSWENYTEIDNSRIISSINLSIKGGSYAFHAGEDGPSFNIYWGDHVSNSILHDYSSSWCYDKQKNELKRWKDNYNKYGLDQGIIVQRNQNNTGMRLVRITQIGITYSYAYQT